MRSGNARMNSTGSTPCQIRWLGVEVEAELLAVVQGLQRPLGRVEVEGDLGRMHFQGELHAALAEHVEDRVEPLGQQLEAVVDHLRRDRREGVEQVPDARTGEAVDDAHAQLLRGPGGVLQFLGGPGVHAGRVAVAPDVAAAGSPCAARR